MAKEKKYAIKFTSEKFKEIKRQMDKTKLEEYVNGIHEQGYRKGYEAGQAAAGPSFDMELAMESIGQIKGIGPVKLEQIKLAMMAAGGK